MLCPLLLHNNLNQLYLHICSLLFDPPSHPIPLIRYWYLKWYKFKSFGKSTCYLLWYLDIPILLCFEHAAAAAKSLQSCPTLCDPIDSSPSGSPVPGVLQAGTLEWVAIFFSNAWKWKVKGKSLSRVWRSATSSCQRL